MNDLNIVKMIPIRPWRYPSNWLKNFKCIARGFKMAYQRITKGFCDWDWYDLDCYYANLIGDSLKEFARKTCSYPVHMKSEEWTEKLDKLGSQFKAYTMEPESAKPFIEEWEKESDFPKSHIDIDIDLKLHNLMIESLKELAEIYGELWD